MKLFESLPSELSDEQRSRAEQLLKRYEYVFSRDEYDIGRTHLIEMQIDTEGKRPIR